MPPQAPALPEEMIEQIFLRLPPNEPACLVHASLASKIWLSHLSGARFRKIYFEFHGSPPMLGFIYHLPFYLNPEQEENLPLLVPTTKFSVRTPNSWGHRKYWPLDCRHGRVVLVDDIYDPEKLVVRDPMTGSHRELDLPTQDFSTYGAAVLCTVPGCDHQSCHGGPCQVVFFALTKGVNGGSLAYVHVSFRETGAWSEQRSSLDLEIEYRDAFLVTKAPVLIERTLYFMASDDDDYYHIQILSYNLASNCLSQIDAPQGVTFVNGILMAMGDGSLGFAELRGLTLYMWSRQMGLDRVAKWTKYKVIDLNNFIHIPSPILIGSMEGNDVIFLTTELGVYELNLKSLLCKKRRKKEDFIYLIPYKSFYTPQGKSVLAEKGETI